MLVTCDVILTYENSAKQKIAFKVHSNFWATSCEENVKNNIYSQKQSGIDGNFFTGSTLDQRYLTIQGFVKNQNIEYAKRELEKVFNPTILGTLYYSNSSTGIWRYIECRVTEIPKIYWSKGRLMFDINLSALKTYWLGKETGEVIALTKKLWHFKTFIPNLDKMCFGIRINQLKTVFDNEGDVASGFRAVMRARYGTVINPVITNVVTDKKLRIICNMEKDDSIIITSYPNDKTITIIKKNGISINGSNLLDFDESDFFGLIVGKNEFGYSADEGTINNLLVSISYIPQFLGV